MKVAHITFNYKPIGGGQEVYIKNLIEVFEKEGIKNVIYQPINKNYHYFTKEKDKNVKLVLNIPFIGRFIPNINKYLFNVFLLLHYFAFFKYDKIIIHYAFHSIPFWFFKKKVIVVSHGVEWYLDGKSINDKISFLIAKLTFNRFALVANDTHYFRTLKIGIKPKEKYFQEIKHQKWFIPNCVDINLFKPKELLEELKLKNIIFVPRQITWDRGIHLAIEAFYLFSKKYKEYTLLIAGGIRSKEYKTYCDSLIDRFNLKNKVVWRYNIKNNNISYFYSSSKMTLIPTIRREGTSLSALESMACGCPVVSTNVAGLADLPTLQAAPEPNDISSKMVELIDNYDEIKKRQMGATREIFNIENWSRTWLKVINN